MSAAASPRPPEREPVQLPLFAEAALLVRVRPERTIGPSTGWKFWPDLFGRAQLVRQ
jgi:hypothetical protein